MLYKDHINKLCKKYNIKKYIRRGIREEAFIKTRIIHIRPIINWKNYIIALHEIGHVVSGNTKDFMTSEVLAWKWARKNTLFWDIKSERFKRKCLKDYRELKDCIEKMENTINNLENKFEYLVKSTKNSS